MHAAGPGREEQNHPRNLRLARRHEIQIVDDPVRRRLRKSDLRTGDRGLLSRRAGSGHARQAEGHERPIAWSEVAIRPKAIALWPCRAVTTAWLEAANPEERLTRD